MPEWIPTPENVEFNMAIKKLDSVVYSVIQERRATLASGSFPTQFQDLLTQMLLVMIVLILPKFNVTLIMSNTFAPFCMSEILNYCK